MIREFWGWVNTERVFPIYLPLVVINVHWKPV